MEPDLESDSSSSSSALSFSSASSSKRTQKDKQISKKTKTAADKPQARKEKSLSPIETVDSYALAHALHDARRRNHAVQSLQADNIAEDLQFDAGVSETGTLGVRNSAMSPALDDQPERERTRSVSVAGDSAGGTRSAKFSLTPLPEAKPLTEEEYEVKFGSVVNIKVEMVYDPRLPVTDMNRELVRKYESPVIVKTREVR